MSFSDVYPAIENRNWYALVALAIWGLIFAWKKLAPDLYYKIPEGWRWLPPIVLAGLTGFIDGYTSGLPWQQSSLRAVWALLTMGIGAMGVHGALAEAPGPYGGGKGSGAGVKLLTDPIPADVESDSPDTKEE